MFTSKRIRIVGAAVSVAVLFAGHSAVTAHADVPGDATLLAGAIAENSLELATADAANANDPDTTCNATSVGGPINDEVNADGRVAVGANDAAAGEVTCFSFSHSTYTLWTKLTIQDKDPFTGAWVDVADPRCVDAPGGMQATGGLIVVPLVVADCPYPINLGATRLHTHRARILFNTNTGKNGIPTPSIDVWGLVY